MRYYRLCNNRTDFIARVKLLKLKLGRRGYNLRTLEKSFLKFCSAYPAPTKYGVHDGNVLWELTVSFELTTSCYSYDLDAVRKLTKACSVVLRDIFPRDRVTDDISIVTDVGDSVSTSDSDVITISTSQPEEPIGLYNPAQCGFITI